MPRKVDTIIDARWIVPVQPNNTVWHDHSIVIDRGIITALVPHKTAHRRFHAQHHITLTDHALVPGLINAHTHAAMSLLRGYADDVALASWLDNYIEPAERAWVSKAFVADGTALAIAEMLASGTTCFNDMYFFPDQAVTVASTLGIRICAGLVVAENPSAWAADGADYIRKGLAVQDEFKGDPLVSFTLAPHTPHAITPTTLEQIRMYSAELGLAVHLHLHETASDIRTARQRWNCRPLAWLEQQGMLGPNLIAVHMTQLTDEDIELVATTRTNVVHCPESNLKLASGFCPVAKLLAADVTVALGTDGAASNNDLDMWGEMRTAALMGKGVAGRADAVTAAEVLRMATLNGAKALGLDTYTGSLEVGKAADITAVDLSGLHQQPVHDVVSNLIYSAGRDCVSDVWVGGAPKLRNRELLDIDIGDLHGKTRQWAHAIANDRRDSTPPTAGPS